MACWFLCLGVGCRLLVSCRLLLGDIGHLQLLSGCRVLLVVGCGMVVVGYTPGGRLVEGRVCQTGFLVCWLQVPSFRWQSAVGMPVR